MWEDISLILFLSLPLEYLKLIDAFSLFFVVQVRLQDRWHYSGINMKDY